MKNANFFSLDAFFYIIIMYLCTVKMPNIVPNMEKRKLLGMTLDELKVAATEVGLPGYALQNATR